MTLYGVIENLIGEKLDLTLLKTLDELCIDARYPGDLGLLPNGKPTKEDAKKFYNFAISIFRRITENL